MTKLEIATSLLATRPDAITQPQKACREALLLADMLISEYYKQIEEQQSEEEKVKKVFESWRP